MTVAVEGVPPITDAGLRLMLPKSAEVTVNVAVCAEPRVPVIVTAVFADTMLVVTAKEAVMALAGTDTLVGT